MRRLLEPHPFLVCVAMAAKVKLGGEIKLHLSPDYKNYFDRIKSKFGELIRAILPLIATGIPSLEEFKTFLERCFEELKPRLSTAKLFVNVMELTIKEKCTVTDIACLETIVDYYNIENARPHITTYKSAVDEICVEFKDKVLDTTRVSTSFKYESIMFVLEWHWTDDFTLNDIDDFLCKAFKDMANTVLFKSGLIRNTANVKWRHDECSVLVVSPSTEQCEYIVSRLKREKEIRQKSFWRIELRSSTTESAQVLIDNLNQFALRELSIEETLLDNRCMSTLAEKFNKVKKLLLNSSSVPTGSIQQVIYALAPTNIYLEALSLWNIPITDDDVNCLSKVISNNKKLKILDLSNCDITDKGVQYLCEGLATNRTLTMLALSNNLQITSTSTSAIVELIKAPTSLEILYLRNTSLKDDDIKIISTALSECTTIQQLVLSEHHQKICKTFINPSIKDKLYFEMEKPSGMRNTASVEWRHDDRSVLVISPSTEQCENIVSRLKREKEIRQKSFWRIELRSSTTESALVLIDNLDQFAVRELCIEDTSLDSRCISTLAEKFTKVKKLLLNSSSLPIGSIQKVIYALAPANVSLEALFLWNVPITDDDVKCLSKVIRNDKTLKILDLSNCDMTDKGVQYICEGVATNRTLTMLALSNNLQITSTSTSAIVELIKTSTSLEILYLRNTSLKDDDIKIISAALSECTTIQQLVLSEQHEKICETFNSSIKDKLYFVMEKPRGMIAVSTSDDRVAEFTRKLQSVTREKEESQKIITTLQTKCYEYKQQLLKTTDISSYLPKLTVILQPVQEDWEQLGLQLNIDQSILTDIRNKRDSTEKMKYLLEELALKGGTLTQLEDALLYLGKKEVISDLHALQEKESIVIDTSKQISTKSNDKSVVETLHQMLETEKQMSKMKIKELEKLIDT